MNKRSGIRAVSSPAQRATMAMVTALFVASGCGVSTRGQPIAVEKEAPPFALPDQDGTVVKSSDLLASGPAVVLFYRGHW